LPSVGEILFRLPAGVLQNELTDRDTTELGSHPDQLLLTFRGAQVQTPRAALTLVRNVVGHGWISSFLNVLTKYGMPHWKSKARV
jgi:hypothetical protein